MTKIKDIIQHLEEIAPLSLQESYDNSGLLTGNKNWEVSAVLICLDSVEAVIDEAIALKCNLVIAHHPIIFKGLKKITGENYIERVIIKAIKNNIAIYAIHTNLDNVIQGVNGKIAEKINLSNTTVLKGQSQSLQKLVTFIPKENTKEVLKALHMAGAGNIGNYSECSFSVEGTGSFMPNEYANPAIGASGELAHVKEDRVELIYPAYRKNEVLAALKNNHPYEEVAYYIQALENGFNELGSGIVGTLKEAKNPAEFVTYLKEKLNLKTVKHTQFVTQPISKIAICGGAGSFLLNHAIMAGADAFITADLKYHEFFDAENKLMILDIGHYESEVFTKELIYDILNKKISNIALRLSEVNSNPIRYS